MKSFKDSFDLGLKAAANAAAVKSEIHSVFRELNSQILEASDGKIQIKQEPRSSQGLNALIGIGLFSGGKQEKIEITTYIVATNPLANKSNKVDIGEISIHKNGYPCEITFGGDKFICEDKSALEMTLSMMLADPDIGKEFTKLMRLPVTKNPDTAQD